jgi:S1-C subfamily serine protease
VKFRCSKCQTVLSVPASAPVARAIPEPRGTPVKEALTSRPGPARKAPVANESPRRRNEEDRDRPRRNEEDRDRPRRKLPTAKSSNGLVIGLVIGGAALLLMLMVGGGVLAWWLASRPEANASPVAIENTIPEAKENPPPVVVAESAKDLNELKAATVFIQVKAGTLSASGSGFLIKKEGNTGYLATNYHVVAPNVRGARTVATDVTVVFQSGTKDEHSHRAEVLAADPENDLAVLKVPGVAALPKAVSLNAAKLSETVPVTVYGFPFGDKLAFKGNPAITVSKGSISSLRRNDRNEVAAVQIDGALNPGNSGGPVLDADSNLVGVATATIPGAHIGLAVPAEELNRLLDGRVGNVGVTVKGASGDRAEVEVEAPLLDPLNHLKSVRVHYLRSDRVKNNLQPGTVWTELAGSEQSQLRMEGGKALGKLTVPAADKDHLYTFQLSFVNASGQTIFTRPKSVQLRSQDVVVVRPPDRPPDRPPVLPPNPPPDKPPTPIKPPPPPAFKVEVPEKDKKLVPLVGPVDDVAVGGGGRYLVLHLSGKKKLAIFDVQEGKVAKELPLAEEPCHFAAGAERLVVIYPNAKLIQQFSLKTFEREKSNVLPGSLTSDTIHQVSMGSASAGPLFVYLPKEKRTLAVNLDKLETTEVKWSNWAPNNAYGPLTMRTSPDGTWLIGHGGGWVGCEVAFFKDGIQTGSNPKIEFCSMGGAFALPSADSRFLFTSWGIHDRSLTQAKVPDLNGCFVVPAAEPGYFLALAKQGDGGANPSGMLDDGSLTVYSDDRKPLFVVGGLEELKTKHAMSWEKRVHYYPRAGLLVTFDSAKEAVVLRRVDLKEQLEKSDTDYLLVVSRPPIAKPGTAFSYKLEILSKKGGVKFKLESGPDGLAVSPTGEVTWKVPAKPTNSEVDVLVTVSDKSGQEVFHNFKVALGAP